MAETTNGELLYQLLEQNATGAELQSLLREYKENARDIRISAVDKKGIVQNLRRAVDSGAIPLTEVQRLASETEENGGQHIFYYVPHDIASIEQIPTGELVAATLLGPDWNTQCGFPHYRISPDSEAWGDFRIERAGTDEHWAWTAKVYSTQAREQLKQEVKENGKRSVVYEEEQVHVVLVAKYHSFGLLEMRVPRWETREGIDGMLERLWAIFAEVLEPTLFAPWDLTKARTRILDERSKHSGQYRVADLRFINSDRGKVTVSTQTTDEDVFQETGRAAAISTLLQNQSVCAFSAVVWVPNKDTNPLERELITLIGSKSSNEVVIRSKATAKAVDYVTFRLRDFSAPS